MRRQAAKLIPRHHILRRRNDHPFCAVTKQSLCRHETKTHAMAVADQARARWHFRANGGERFVAARGSDAVRRSEQSFLQPGIAAGPLRDFQASAQLGIRLID